MYINEIPPNTKIIVKAKLNNNETIFETTTLELNNKTIENIEKRLNSKFIIVKSVEVDDKRVNFDAKNVSLEIEALVDNKNYIWKKVIISSITIPNIGKVNIILSNNNVNFTNRRNNFRVSVGIRTIATINNKRISVTIKDLSNTGIGLLIGNESSCEIGDNIKLSFEDKKMKASFNIDCIVVRVQEISDRYILLGCTIRNVKPDPSYYITRLQRESLRHQ